MTTPASRPTGECTDVIVSVIIIATVIIIFIVPITLIVIGIAIVIIAEVTTPASTGECTDADCQCRRETCYDLQKEYCNSCRKCNKNKCCCDTDVRGNPRLRTFGSVDYNIQ